MRASIFTNAACVREISTNVHEAWDLVPKKGLEPPHPCGYMDLNHARLPIPPLRLWAGAPGGIIGATPNIYLLILHNLCQTTRPDILCVKLLLSLRNVVK